MNLARSHRFPENRSTAPTASTAVRPHVQGLSRPWRLLLLAIGLFALTTIASWPQARAAQTATGLAQEKLADQARDTGMVQIILLRHAEKSNAGGSDPELSEQGTQRAESLARLFANSEATRFFASQFKRTQDTLAPWAESTGGEVEVYDAHDSEGLVVSLRSMPPGTTVAVAAHSNTTPELARLLGAEPRRLNERGGLREDEYSRIFVLTVPVGGSEEDEASSTMLLELSY